MNSAEMSKVLRNRAGRMREPGLTVGELCDNAELLAVLARIVEGKSIERAFGRPGDWGYNHPVGRALAASETEVKL